jgi:hypothetical protein
MAGAGPPVGRPPPLYVMTLIRNVVESFDISFKKIQKIVLKVCDGKASRERRLQQYQKVTKEGKLTAN